MENSANTKRKAVALLVIVFALGLALGALGMQQWAARVYGRSFEGHGHHDPAKMVNEMTRELSLTPEQQKQLQVILEDTRTRFQAIYEQVRPQYDVVRDQARSRIRTILTPDQLPKYEEFNRRLDEERKKKYPPPGGPK